MKFSLFAASLALVASVVASPLQVRNGCPNCLSKEAATTLVNRFIGVLDHAGSDLGDANATAQAILDNNYQEISDSILSLEGQPLGGVTFQGKQEYIGGVLNAPPVEGITTIRIYVADCNSVLWYWNFLGVGSGQYEIKGFNLFTLNAAGQILTTELEFNSIAWGLDTGYQIIFPPSS
ncbi:hypothetical protein H2198_000281 [Neophaeococcomyces mojaviensis]|uniref:Uncharacterized protein n=1 Tax=Neophaeococcomyces mojaviensis TaxID=3383035 RepID=A0ACC3AKA7_9EURO|nr:hypothetical protein H2198_000281 [Knufia sp. JES_112]